MIDWQKVEDHHRNCRAILDWLSDLQSRAIEERQFDKASEVYRIASLIYAGPHKGENG